MDQKNKVILKYENNAKITEAKKQGQERREKKDNLRTHLSVNFFPFTAGLPGNHQSQLLL